MDQGVLIFTQHMFFFTELVMTLTISGKFDYIGLAVDQFNRTWVSEACPLQLRPYGQLCN